MNAGNWAAVICSAFAMFGVWASSRNARKATEKNAVVVSATELEKARATAESEAYNRARKFDVETIERQDKELDELRQTLVGMRADVEMLRANEAHLNNDLKLIAEDNRQLHAVNDRLREQNMFLKRKIERIEKTPTVEREAIRLDALTTDTQTFDVRTDTDPYMREIPSNGSQ